MDKLQIAEQFRKALQMFAQSLPDEKAMEISTLYPKYEVGKKYSVDEIVSYGENSVGDPQLYRILQKHTSQLDWKPSDSASLYSPIGLNESGFPTWAQPTGSHDAYNNGDIVEFNSVLYKSIIDGNVWSPEVYPDGWIIYVTN